MEATEFVFLNDQLVDANKATISIFDTSVMHGVGLFESMRAYNGKIFRLEDHLDRLLSSASQLKLNITQSRAEITNAIVSLLEANNLSAKDARLRLTITPGSLREVTEDGPPKNSIIITASAMPIQRGQKIAAMPVIISSYRLNSEEPTSGHKTLNYFNRLTILQQAHVEGFGEALCFSVKGFLCGGCLNNIFLVKDGKLITPALTKPVIPGITRKVVLEIARKSGIKTDEHDITSQELMEADEIFLTGSSQGIIPASNIGGHKIGEGDTGVITSKIIDKYQELVS